MKSLAVIKVGDTFSAISKEIGDFEKWIIDGIGPSSLPVSIIDARDIADLPAADSIAAAIVTGSHSMVTERAPWSENLAAWLRSAVLAKLPLLGICYGHQLLAHALGGEVGDHPDGIELGTVSVGLTEHADSDPLFKGLPGDFSAQAAHRQSVRRLPQGAVLLAGNAFEPHHAFRAGECAWGVQFHPEFSPAAMAGYIAALEKDIGGDEPMREAAPSKVLPTVDAASLLPRFASLVEQRMQMKHFV